MKFKDVDDCAWVGFVDVKCGAVPVVVLCRELAQRTREGVHVDDRVDCVSAEMTARPWLGGSRRIVESHTPIDES
ncbi:hypothetical protein BJI47_00475 [Rhodococcus sp. 1168]|nr:hypothetical protein BJI47_00475 [Rhodococcus sp. 1168]